MADIAVNIAGLSLEHPAMLGSGPIGVRRKDLLDYGQVASALITKSTTPEPSTGSEQPRIVKIDHDGMLNYEGGPNPGIEKFSETLKEVIPSIPCPIIGSISPYTLRDESTLERMVEKFIGAGAKGIELDFKYLYDQASGLTDFYPRELTSICRRVRSVTDLIVIAKLAIGAISLADLTAAAEDGGASAISAINTPFPAMRISLRTRRPTLSMKFGGLSGAPIRPLAVATIYQLRQLTKLPLIGVGGIMTAEDLVEFMLAGASAVQVYTAAQVRGSVVFSEIRSDLIKLLHKMGVRSVSELIGAAHDEQEAYVEARVSAENV
jgi:dihydroorotate dehydrogenase subfamily 1